MEKMTREENEKLADGVITPIIMILDVAVEKYDPEKLKATLEAMNDQAGFTSAWPMQETMDKGDEMRVQNKIFETIINLIELRRSHKELVIKQHKNRGANNHLLNSILGGF